MGRAGTGPIAFSVAQGLLPPGLGLSTSGQLSGTPTQPGSYRFTVEAVDVNGCVGTGSHTVTIDGVRIISFTAHFHDAWNVLLAWQTASEADTAGFTLHRRPYPNGAWQQVGDGLIPAQGAGGGASYEFVDKPGNPDQMVWQYEVRQIDSNANVLESGYRHRNPRTDSALAVSGMGAISLSAVFADSARRAPVAGEEPLATAPYSHLMEQPMQGFCSDDGARPSRTAIDRVS